MDSFAVDDSGAFAVGTAQVETDPAAFKIAAEFDGDLLFGGGIGESAGSDLKFSAVDAFTPDLIIKCPFAFFAVNFAEVGGDQRSSGDGDGCTAESPEHEFDDTLDVTEVQVEIFRSVGKNFAVKTGNRTIGTFQGDGNINGTVRSGGGFAELPVPESGGDELGIKFRSDPAGNSDLVHKLYSFIC